MCMQVMAQKVAEHDNEHDEVTVILLSSADAFVAQWALPVNSLFDNYHIPNRDRKKKNYQFNLVYAS